jgi:hypothetical protein
VSSNAWLTRDPDPTVARVGSPPGLGPRRLAAAVFTAPTGSPVRRVAAHTALLGGAVAVASSGLVHLYLWADGYRNVATIGPLFLAQGLAGLVLAVTLVVYPRAFTAGLGATYLLASVTALALSVTRGFLGVMDTLDAPWATPALLVESTGALLLILGGALTFRRSWTRAHTIERTPREERR